MSFYIAFNHVVMYFFIWFLRQKYQLLTYLSIKQLQLIKRTFLWQIHSNKIMWKVPVGSPFQLTKKTPTQLLLYLYYWLQNVWIYIIVFVLLAVVCPYHIKTIVGLSSLFILVLARSKIKERILNEQTFWIVGFIDTLSQLLV